MLTCLDMFTTLNIDLDALLPCCSGMCRFSLDNKDNQFSTSNYLRYLAMMQQRFSHGRPTCENTCDKLKDVPEEHLRPFPDRLAFKRVLINHHRNYCNCRCTYCPFWNVTPKPPLISIAAMLRSLIDEQAVDDNCTFAWGGGESTILPEFEEMVTLLADRGYRQYVHTNAIRFSPAVAEVLQRGLAVVNVSLDSGDAASYASIKGVDAWNRVIANLARYRKSLSHPEALEIKYIFNAETADPRRMMDFFTVCQRLDIKKVLYSFDINDRPWQRYAAFAELFVHKAQGMGMTCGPFRG